MTLEQQLSGSVLKTQEDELIKLIGNANVVIKSEKKTSRIDLLKELIKNYKLKAKIWDSEHRLSYVAAINLALVNEADELIIINNNPYINQEKIRQRINNAMNDELVKQIIEIHKNKYDYKLCPISIIDFNY